MDETGRPLYGDVFGLESHDSGAKEVEQDVDKEMWGELEPEEESSSEEEVRVGRGRRVEEAGRRK